MPPKFLLPPPVDLFVAPLIQERAARITDHRPWPPPRRPWVMAQSWVDLLFAHWAVPPAALERAVPSQLMLDTYDGQAWIGVTPFEVRNLRLRPTLPVPKISRFPEINVRTYVTFGGRPGIYFFSLDADSRLAVATARRAYRLPYFRSRMSIQRTGSRVRCTTERHAEKSHVPRAALRAEYRGLGNPSAPEKGTLAHWLSERYCLYTLDDRERVLRGEIHHPPWPLQAAEAEISHNTMGDELGLQLSGEPLLHYAARQDVAFWTLQPAE